MKDLKITMIQSDLIWEKPEENISWFDNKIDKINDTPDIIILPEMFNNGFSINPAKCAETMYGYTIDWLQKKAKSRNCVITGSILIKEKENNFNRMVWMRPDGDFDTYDKRHLFRMSDEYKLMNYGNKRTLVEINGWKINLLVCYDLRFPVWSRNTYKYGKYEFDMIIYVANWPASRSHIWQTLLKARAIENQCYVAGVNRVGYDGFGTPYSGDSMIVDPIGIVLSQLNPNEEITHTEILSMQALVDFRKAFTVGLDWDEFELK
jgi:omega-amidase